MKRLYLIVFTGWPSDGKTTIAKNLELSNCAYLSTDIIREELYPEKLPLEIPYPSNWEPIWDNICKLRDHFIMNKKHVIIDSCAQNKYIRDKYFTFSPELESWLQENSITLLRKLILLDVNHNESIRRELVRGRNLNRLDQIKTAMKKDFQDPMNYIFPGLELLVFKNNTFEDQKKIVYFFKELLIHEI